jgi:uncharacterized protein YwbE
LATGVGAVKVSLPFGVLQLVTLVAVDVGAVTTGLVIALLTAADTHPDDISFALVE